MRPAASLTVRTPSQPHAVVLALEPVHRRMELPAIVLTNSRTLIGSGADCDFRLSLAGVEPRHCTVVVVDGRPYLQSLAPRTWLNNAPARRAILREGDRVTIGPWEFRARRATTEDLLHYLPDQPSAPNQPEVSTKPAPAPTSPSPLETLQALERELRRELAEPLHLSSEPLESILDDVDRDAETPPPLPVELEEPSAAIAEPPHTPSEEDREKLGSLLAGWEAEAETLRSELLAQAEVLNSEIKRQQEELHELQEETRRSAAELAREQKTRQELRGGRERHDAAQAELQRREQELAERAATLEKANRVAAEERARQELSWQQQQVALGATAQWWEQRRADFGRRQAHLANVSDLLLDTERQLLDSARRQQAELLEREQRLSKWEQTLTAQNGFSSARLADAERAVAANSVRDLELQERERNLSDRFTATEAREQRLSAHERELQSIAAELDRREQELETRTAAFARECEQRQQSFAARDSDQELRGMGLVERELAASHERARLELERQELDEEVSRLHQLRRQIELEREQFDSERNSLAEEQARFRDDCDRYLEAVETLEEEQRQFSSQVAAAKNSAPALLAAQNEAAAKLTAEQESLDALRVELARSESRIGLERERLRQLEQSLGEESEILRSERESLLTERLAWDQERLQIDRQRQQAASDQAELTAERDRLQVELQDLEANRSQLGAELDLLRNQQDEVNSQIEHRHAEVSDWLQEHAELTQSGPVPLLKEIQPPQDSSSPSAEISNYGDRPEIEYRRTEPVAETDAKIYDWTRGLADSLGLNRSGSDYGSSSEDLEHQLEERTEPSRDADQQPAAGGDLTSETPDAPAKEGHVRSLLAEMFNIPLPRAVGNNEGNSTTEAPRGGSTFTDEDQPVPKNRGRESGDWYRERNREDELFRSSDAKRTRDLPEPQEQVAQESHDQLEAASSTYSPPVIDTPALEELLSGRDNLARQSEPEVLEEPTYQMQPAVPAPLPPAPSAADYTLQNTDPDSIADYMERLLQRNRRRGSDDYEPTASLHSLSSPAISRPADPIPVSLSNETAPNSPDHANETSPVIEHEPDLPARPRADAQEVRAGIDSLRQVANLSARTAVASHTWKRNRNLVVLRAILMLAASAVAAFLLLGPLAAEERFGMSGMAALFIAIVAGADFARAVWHIYSLNLLRRTSERNVIAGRTAPVDEFGDHVS